MAPPALSGKILSLKPGVRFDCAGNTYVCNESTPVDLYVTSFPFVVYVSGAADVGTFAHLHGGKFEGQTTRAVVAWDMMGGVPSTIPAGSDVSAGQIVLVDAVEPFNGATQRFGT